MSSEVSGNVTPQRAPKGEGGAEAAYWVSWYQSPVPFTWHGPWWISGYRYAERRGKEVEQATICAAVWASSEEDARRWITESHDTPVVLEWRFTNRQPPDWSPFSSRFRRADWMTWPWPTPTDELVRRGMEVVNRLLDKYPAPATEHLNSAGDRPPKPKRKTHTPATNPAETV